MTIGIESLGQSLTAAALVGLLCGMLGPFVVWRRVALMGDALAHANLGAIGVAIVLEVPWFWIVIPFSVGLSQLLAWLDEKGKLENDALLAIFFAGFLALGTLFLTQTGHGTHELVDALMGELELIDNDDLALLVGLNLLVGFYFLRFREDIVLMVLHPDLARTHGVPVRRHHYVTIGLMALTVAISLKLSGVILLTALLLVPALIARLISNRVRGQLLGATVLGPLLSVAGLLFAKLLQWPVGPSIAALGFLVFLGVASLRFLVKGRA